jgi:PAS domain S-box-containing protein
MQSDRPSSRWSQEGRVGARSLGIAASDGGDPVLDGAEAVLRPIAYDSRESNSAVHERDERWLTEVGRVLRLHDDPQRLFVEIAGQIATYFEVDRCVFSDIVVAENLVIARPGYEPHVPSIAGSYTLDSFGEETRAWLLAGRIVVTTDTCTDPRTRDRYASAYEPIRVRASVAVPTLRDGICVGAVSVTSSVPRHWTAREIALLEAVVTRTWLFVEHGRAIKTLQQSERHYRRIVESSHEGIWEIDEQHATRFVNPRMASLLGYSSSEMIGRRLDYFMDDEGRALLASAVERRQSGIAEGHDFKFKRSDGSDLWARLETNPLFEDGRYVGALAMVADITDRKKAEREKEELLRELQNLNAELEERVRARTAELSAALEFLRENEARFRRLFHDSPIALCEQDFSRVKAYLDALREQGVPDLVAHLRAHPEVVAEAAKRVRFIEVNDATLTMYEAESREQILSNWSLLFGKEMREVFVEELCFLIEGKGSTFAAHTATRTLKGKRNEIDLRLTILPGSERTWSRLVASIFDMTAYHEAERKLRAALREKEVLLKEVHHRVKNNLQVISSLLSLQAHHVEEGAARAVFASSQSRVQSIALVHEKLYQAKDLSHVRFQEYVDTLTADLFHAQSAPDLSVERVVSVADINLTVDVAIPCGLIVNELVSNALIHAFRGRASGTVRIEARRLPEGRLELSVADDGVGFPAHIDPRSTPSLGLDLVFTFAEQLGAEVEITRERGTRFVFRFEDHEA